MSARDNYFAPRVEFNPYTHTWSLGVEEQFYVLFPTLFYLWLRFRNSESQWRRPSRYLFPLLFLASLCYSIYATRETPVSAYYGLPSRFWELAAGALLFQSTTAAAVWPGAVQRLIRHNWDFLPA